MKIQVTSTGFYNHYGYKTVSLLKEGSTFEVEEVLKNGDAIIRDGSNYVIVEIENYRKATND